MTPAVLALATPGAPLAAVDFYRHVMRLLEGAGIPFLVGGAYAFARHTGIQRPTKDLDLFLRRADCRRALQVLQQAGYATEDTHPHWLAKAYGDKGFVDLIHSSANGIAAVDDVWFAKACPAEVLGLPAQLVPVEEKIWSKLFIMERERFDGADVVHLVRYQGHAMDWQRLLQRVGPHWRVLLGHLVFFGFIYPAQRDLVPSWVMVRLLRRLQEELRAPPLPDTGLCQGTLLSRQQYLDDLQRGCRDAREAPAGTMSAAEIAAWTAAIGAPEKEGGG